MTDQDTFRKDGIVFPAGQIDVSGFEARYASFQRQSVAPRGKETAGVDRFRCLPRLRAMNTANAIKINKRAS